MAKPKYARIVQEVIDDVLGQMRKEQGDSFDAERINLAEFCRRTGFTRSRARTLKKNGFKVTPHGRCGKKSDGTVLAGYTGVLDDLLRQGITNSSVCLARLKEHGYAGGATTVKNYIAANRHLVPAKRQLVAPQGSRGRRFGTDPGEAYQMDWGFAKVEDWEGRSYRLACFAMICHHCGERYVEFFPNARQENLFIGMIRAFACMGVPAHVLTDNMRSVVIRRDFEGRPVWQADYEAFMRTVGFETRLCKPRHPFTKGKVERLIRFVKGNFLAGRAFEDITGLNADALAWCSEQNGVYHRSLGFVPEDEHRQRCMQAVGDIDGMSELAFYLCPERKISFDGFVNYEGRRFGVPYAYTKKTCRVSREGRWVHIYSDDMSRELAVHPVTWDARDSFCQDQYPGDRPCELPSEAVNVTIRQLPPEERSSRFDKFDFGKGTA